MWKKLVFNCFKMGFLQTMPGPKSPFTSAQEQEIVFQFGSLRSAILVRRWFRQQYPHINPKDIPHRRQFSRVIDRFKSHNSTHNSKPTGRPVSVTTEELIENVRQLVSNDDSLSIAEISIEVEASQTSVWKILRKHLKLYPYKPHNVQPLTDAHIANRVEFCHWIRSKPPAFPNLVIFSDEKMFTLKQAPNRQNERCLIDGKILIHWFEQGQTVNQHVYLDLLQSVALCVSSCYQERLLVSTRWC